MVQYSIFILLMGIVIARAEELTLPFIIHFPGYLRRGTDKIHITADIPETFEFVLQISNKENDCEKIDVHCPLVMHLVKKKDQSNISFSSGAGGEKFNFEQFELTGKLFGPTTFRISCVDKSFTIKITSKDLGSEKMLQKVYDIPLSIGSVIKVTGDNRSDGKGIHKVFVSPTLKSKNIYYPRFRDTNLDREQLREAKQNVNNCTEHRRHRKNYIYYDEATGDCKYPENTPEEAIYFELLPQVFAKCPCECWHNPDDFVALRFLEEYQFKEDKVTTVFFEWSSTHRMTIELHTNFTLEFFTKLNNNKKGRNGKECAELQDTPTLVITSHNGTVIGDNINIVNNTNAIIMEQTSELYLFNSFSESATGLITSTSNKDSIIAMRVQGGKEITMSIKK